MYRTVHLLELTVCKSRKLHFSGRFESLTSGSTKSHMYPGANSLYTIKLSKHGWISVGMLLPYYKRDRVTGEWRPLRRERLHALYSSPNIIRLIRSRRMRLAEQVSREGEGERTGAYRLLVGKN